MTPEQIVSEWLDMRLTPAMGSELNQLISAIRAYGEQECAAGRERPEWQPIEPKPADWDREYSVMLTGKNLEAMHYLARFVLDRVRDPYPLPFGVIASADHLFCLAAIIRRSD